MIRPGTFALALVLLAGCESKKPEGLPAAKDWSAPTAPGADVDLGAMPTPRGQGDPHAGVPGAPPLGGGGGGGGDPHAGIPGAPPLGGGGGGGVDVTQMGLPAPDPTRPVDPNRYLEGQLTVSAANAGKVPVGGVIFLSVRAADPATGQGVGTPISTDKLEVTGAWPLGFRLDESKPMVGGTSFAGDVVIAARYDQDGDAISKQPGDIAGQVRAVIPAKGLTLSLDDVLP